jgi:predicted DNA-binding transcriptional regulator YafY
MGMPVGLDPDTAHRLQILRVAAQARRWVKIAYHDGEDRTSARRVRPLGCFYWGAVWTLAAWCESRRDFRSFRLDRIAEERIEASTLPVEPDKSLAELLRRETGRSVLGELR